MLVNLLRAVGALLLFVPRSRAALPIALWITLIGWLGSWSSAGVGSLGGGLWLTNFGHAPLYGMLGLWMLLAIPRDEVRPRWSGASAGTPGSTAGRGPGPGGWPRLWGAGGWLVLAGVALVGIGDEAHQYLGDRGRDFSLLDVVTDVTGAACVVWIVAYLGRDEAGDRGLVLRLGAGLLACAAAAGLATGGGTWFPDVAWL